MDVFRDGFRTENQRGETKGDDVESRARKSANRRRAARPPRSNLERQAPASRNHRDRATNVISLSVMERASRISIRKLPLSSSLSISLLLRSVRTSHGESVCFDKRQAIQGYPELAGWGWGSSPRSADKFASEVKLDVALCDSSSKREKAERECEMARVDSYRTADAVIHHEDIDPGETRRRIP